MLRLHRMSSLVSAVLLLMAVPAVSHAATINRLARFDLWDYVTRIALAMRDLALK